MDLSQLDNVEEKMDSFFAELDGPDEIRMDPGELAEAGWFERGSLPADHSEISLTGEMIELFRRGAEPH